MNYRVIIQPGAQAEIEEAYGYIQERSLVAATRWYNGLVTAIESLASFPERCSLAPESDAFDEEIRQLLYGKKSGVYRILFTIRGDAVHILHVRHGARRFLG